METQERLNNILHDKTILKNKLNIKDQEKLLEREKLITAIKVMYYFDSSIRQLDFNMKRLIETNKYLVKDIYDFAGKIRDIDMIHLDYLEKYGNLIDFISAKNIKNEFDTLMYNLNQDYTYYTDIEKNIYYAQAWQIYIIFILFTEQILYQ